MVAKGWFARVPQDSFCRPGHEGEVVDVFEDSVAIDFFCDVFGDPKGLPTIETWSVNEVELYPPQVTIANVLFDGNSL